MLISNLDLLAAAPGGVARLRELILTLAVQGKLVPQDPDDEPASELLKKIRAEKERLIAEGKIKRDKLLVDISEDEIPFGIPKRWKWTRLGDVTNYGSPIKASRIQDETWVLDMEDIEKTSGRLLQRLRFAERPALSDKNRFSKGDVLYGKLRPYLNKVLVADEDGVCTTEIIPFRCHGDYVPQYFRLALSSPYFLDYVNGKSYGMKMPRLGTDDARKAVIPVPPLAEQTRIVTRVEELMRLCEALEAKGQLEATQHAQLVSTLLGTLNESETPEELTENWQRIATHFDLLLDRPEAVGALEQTILQLAVRGLLVPQDPLDEPASELLKKIRAEKDKLIAEGKIKRDKPLPPIAEAEKPFALPMGWEWVRLGSVTSLVTSGSRSWKDFYATEGATFIRSQDIKFDRLEFDERAFVKLPPGAEGSRTQVFLQDLLITITGANVGKAAVVMLPIPEAYVSQHVALVRLMNVSVVDYLHLWLVGEHEGRRLLLMSSYGAKPGLNLQNINDLLVPVPPHAEQSRIVARVASLRALCVDLRQRIASARNQQSLLAEALLHMMAKG